MKNKIIITALAALHSFCACAQMIIFDPSQETAEEAEAQYKKGRAIIRAQMDAYTSDAAIYYHSKWLEGREKLADAANSSSAAVSNLLAELNSIPHAFERLGHGSNVKYMPGQHQARRRSRRLRNELFELGAIPIQTNDTIWVDGMALALNGFSVPDDVREVLISLNWFEQNENPLKHKMHGSNSARIAQWPGWPIGVDPEGVDWCRSYLWGKGITTRFDHNFNLWRLSPPLKFDDEGNLATKFDRDGNILE